MAKILSAEVKIKKKNNNKYCLYSKKENKLLTPCIYDKIEKLGKEAVKVKQNNKYGIFYNTGKGAIPVKYDGFIFPDENSVAFNFLGISFASLNNIYAYNEDTNKKFLIKTIDRYNNGVKTKETTPALLPAKIKETITFNNFGTTISYDSIIIPNNTHTNTHTKDARFNIYETSNIGVTIDTSKAKPYIITRRQGWNPTATTKDKAIAIITAPIWLPIVIVCFPVFMFFFREG